MRESAPARIRSRVADRLGPGPVEAYRHLRRDGAMLSKYWGSKKGRASLAELRRLRGRYTGERCVIIGNGPSIRDMDLSLLRDEYTWGMNRIYLLFDEMGFETTFLTVVAAPVLEQFSRELLTTSCKKFFNIEASQHLAAMPPEVTYFASRLTNPHFAVEPIPFGLYEGYTVTYVCMQLAYHLGFSRVALIGVDHRFSNAGPPGTLVTSSGADPNHFDPAYFGKGVAWFTPDLEQSEIAYRLANLAYGRAGRQIFDATVGGALDVFPKIDLEEFLGR
jgi:hypothetical protein